jgi:CDP-glucose 4,6-dehydratase
MSAPLADAFRGRRVLVTGHTGFKGSWLTIWLERLGARVSGFALAPPTKPSNFEASRVRELVDRHDEGDVRNLERVRAAVDGADPEIVFHLAAQALVRTSYASPAETFASNVMGTVNLLDAVRGRGRPCVVVVATSDKCYENVGKSEGYRETDRLGGADPYSASKAAAELVIESYRRSFFDGDGAIRLASARAGNVIGGGDWAPDRIAVDAARALAANEPVPVRNPRSVRPWQHVVAPVQGYLALAARLLGPDGGRFAGAWNFGPRPTDAASVRALVEALCTAWGGGGWADRSDPAAVPEATHLALDPSKAELELGWRSAWALDEAATRTARWYAEHYGDPWRSMRKACLRDIEAYETATR